MLYNIFGLNRSNRYPVKVNLEGGGGEEKGEDGMVVEAEVYVTDVMLEARNMIPIPHGDYRKHLHSKKVPTTPTPTA